MACWTTRNARSRQWDPQSAERVVGAPGRALYGEWPARARAPLASRGGPRREVRQAAPGAHLHHRALDGVGPFQFVRHLLPERYRSALRNALALNARRGVVYRPYELLVSGKFVLDTTRRGDRDDNRCVCRRASLFRRKLRGAQPPRGGSTNDLPAFPRRGSSSAMRHCGRWLRKLPWCA